MTTWCLLFEEETRICMLRANFGPRMASVILPALAQVIAYTIGFYRDCKHGDRHSQVKGELRYNK